MNNELKLYEAMIANKFAWATLYINARDEKHCGEIMETYLENGGESDNEKYEYESGVAIAEDHNRFKLDFEKGTVVDSNDYIYKFKSCKLSDCETPKINFDMVDSGGNG